MGMVFSLCHLPPNPRPMSKTKHAFAHCFHRIYQGHWYRLRTKSLDSSKKVRLRWKDDEPDKIFAWYNAGPSSLCTSGFRRVFCRKWGSMRLFLHQPFSHYTYTWMICLKLLLKTIFKESRFKQGRGPIYLESLKSNPNYTQPSF